MVGRQTPLARLQVRRLSTISVGQSDRLAIVRFLIVPFEVQNPRLQAKRRADEISDVRSAARGRWPTGRDIFGLRVAWFSRNNSNYLFRI
jgi:hypothetical protein